MEPNENNVRLKTVIKPFKPINFFELSKNTVAPNNLLKSQIENSKKPKSTIFPYGN